MLTNEQLQEKLSQLTYEKQQLERFKHLNELILNGLNAILSSDKHDEIFQKLFAVIHEAISCQHIMLLMVDEQEQRFTVVGSTNQHLNISELPLEPLRLIRDSTHNFFNVKRVDWWQTYFAVTFNDVESLLSHPFSTSQSHYVLMLLGNKRGVFGAPIQELLVSFTSFFANTLTQFETRKLIVERDQLLQRQKNIEQSLVQQEKMASLGQLAAGIAHELNNPLGFVYSNLDTLRVYLSDIEKVVQYHSINTKKIKDTLNIDIDYLLDGGKDIINESLEGAVRAREIINNLRIYSHPDEKSTKVTCLNGLLETAVKIANTQVKYNSVMDLQLAEDKPNIIANANQLNQVIINLIINANQAVPVGKGIITLNCRRQGNSCYVDIADNGSGIPVAIQHKIFEPFFTTKLVGQGTGLGLSLSKAIVEQHSGTIELCHSDADGTLFRLHFPIAPN
jgi:two-component system NtrC family sensor kinase